MNLKPDLGGRKVHEDMKTATGGQCFHGDKSLTMKERREVGLGLKEM